jgi:hypothetical protein
MEQGTIVVADDEANIAELVDLYLSREEIGRASCRERV